MKSSLLAKLLLFTTLVTISVISRANEELMMQQCHNSDNPTLCPRCLNSDPTSPEANPVGLARIILKCINSHLLTLTKNASTLGSLHHRNHTAAAALKQCGLGYATAKHGVGEADAHLIAGDYDKAASDVLVHHQSRDTQHPCALKFPLPDGGLLGVDSISSQDH